MAKDKPAAAPAKKPAAKKSAAKPVKVVMRRECLGKDKDQVIGEVTLVEGVSLNFLVDAVRNGIAGQELAKAK